jgi:hypothetical protein
MASKIIRYKDFTSNLWVTKYAVEDEPVEIEVASDDTEHEVTVISPNYQTTSGHVGGRPNNRT